MGTWKMKRHDTTPALQTTLVDSDGSAVILTGASVQFLMRSVSDSELKVDAAMAFVTDGSDGQVKYVWQAADTDEAGQYFAEYQVTYADTTVQTFPTVGFDRVLIYGDLDDD